MRLFLAISGLTLYVACAHNNSKADVDGDGVTVADGDCDDLDSSVFPGAADPARRCELGCQTFTDWQDVLPQEDPEGDAGGYLVDVRQYQYRIDGPILWLRLVAWSPFDSADPSFQVDMNISPESASIPTVSYNLSYDADMASPLQLWGTENGYDDVLPYLPTSMRACEDEADTFVLAVDPAELNELHDPEMLWGNVHVDWQGANNYSDFGPDSDRKHPICLRDC